MIVYREADNTLSAEWREFAGGPLADVIGVTITITPLAGGAAVVGPTATGVLNPSTGVNAYVWTPGGALALGDYLVEWSGTDSDSDVVTATEIVTLSTSVVSGGAYATVTELRRRMSIADTNNYVTDDLQAALNAASRGIDRYCGRTFGRTEVADASERTFEISRSGIQTDDFWTTDGLIINGTAWASVTGILLEPLNGVLDGLPGWPFLRLTWTGDWPPAWSWTATWGPRVCTVTAAWGWQEVPPDVKSACLMLAEEEMKLPDTPFGVAGFGDYAIRVRSNPKVAERLAPFRVRVGMAA